jgi:RHS repeat-associated protein
LNNLITVNQGVQTRSFVYDSLSRLKQASNPESGIINYVYDNNSNLLSKTDARNVVTNYVYDNLNRVKTRSYPTPNPLPANYQATPDVAYTYDNLPNAKGKLIKVNSSVSTTEYTSFDILGRVQNHKQRTDNNDYTTAYIYNLSGALIEETYPSGRVVRNTLDVDGDLAQVQSKKLNGTYQNYANAFTYTSAGAVSSIRLGNGKFENTTFNSRLQPIQIGLGSSATSQNLLKLNFDYGVADNNGNVKSQIITTPTVGNIAGFVATQVYSYDSLNRIQQATETVANQPTQGWQQTFAYDRYGNRTFDPANTTTLPKNCGTIPNKFVCATDIPKFNPAANVGDNKLVGTNYDNVGNTKIDANGQVFTYDAENKQTKVVNAQGVTLGEYFYNGDGQRVKKVVPSTQETTIFVYDAAGKTVAEYSTISANQADAKINYTTTDLLGSPRINTDANGQVISRHDYQPYGEEILRANYGNDSVRQKFTGYLKDDETELDFAEARMYSNKLGRFTTVDPLMASADIINPQTLNRYVYVGNNPVNITDPTGTIWGSNGNVLTWFGSQKELLAAGNTVYDSLIGTINGARVALNPNAGTWTPITNNAQTLRDLALAGASATQLAASAGILGTALATAGVSLAAGGLVYVYHRNPAAASRLRSSGCPAIIECMSIGDERLYLNGDDSAYEGYLQMTNSGEVSSSTQAETSPDKATPDTEGNKPDTSASGGASGGGKDGRKINKNRKESSEQREQGHRDELRQLEGQPRTTESRQRIETLKKQIKHEQLKQRKSEPHGRKAKGS